MGLPYMPTLECGLGALSNEVLGALEGTYTQTFHICHIMPINWGG